MDDSQTLATIECELVDILGPAIQLEPKYVPHIDLNDKWCVYLTTHPKGFYYYGKGITQAVHRGAYKGSGTSLHASWVWYPKDEWSSVVLETFPSEPLDNQNKDPGEAKAYSREAEIVNFDMLCDPFCMNDVPGGKGGRSWGRISARALEKRKQAVAKSWEDPEIRAKHRLGSVAYWASPEARERQRENARKQWQQRKDSTEYQAQLEIALIGRQEKIANDKKIKEQSKDERASLKGKKLSIVAKTRLEQNRKDRFLSLIDFFEMCLTYGVYTKNGVLKVVETLKQFSESPKGQDIEMFTEWLDNICVLRWGSVEHKHMLQKDQLEKRRRIDELEIKRHAKLNRVYKMSVESRTKMASKQKAQPLMTCQSCKGSFKPAALKRFHGEKCKTK